MANRTTPGTPKAVSKAAKKAEEIHEQIYGKPEDGTNEEETAAAPEAQDDAKGDDIQPVEPSAEPAAGEDTAAAPPPEAAPAPAPEPAPPPQEDWEQKYRALQGKYNAEVPRMAADIRSLRDELTNMRQAPPPQPAAEAPEPKQEKPIVSDQDVVDYGEDLIDLIRRVARGEVSTVEANLTPKLQEVQGQVAKTVQKQASDGVYSTLNREVQDWRDINKSAEFLAWLDQSDPYAGDIRKNLLSDAFKSGDGDRVAAFFKGYLAERQIVTPQPAPQTQAPAAESASQMSLEQLAGPAGGGNGAPPATQQAPEMWNRAQVAKFYQDVAAGHFAKDPQRKAHIENSIAAAMREGRIQ